MKETERIEIRLTKEEYEKLEKAAKKERRTVNNYAAFLLMQAIKVIAFVLIGTSLGFLVASFVGCSAPMRTERDVIRVWGTPSSVIPDSGWRILHYVSPDKTTNDFGIWDKTGAVFFHSNF